MESQGASPIQFGGTRSLRFPHPPPPWIRRLETLGMLLVRIAEAGDLSLFFLETRGMGALDYARYIQLFILTLKTHRCPLSAVRGVSAVD